MREYAQAREIGQMTSQNSVRAQTGPSGTVWSASGDGRAADTDLMPAAFVDSVVPYLGDRAFFRVLGRTDNASLIENLCSAKAAGQWPLQMRARIGSPRGYPPDASPAALLDGVWRAGISFDAPGDWYELSDTDHAAFAMVAEVAACDAEGRAVSARALRLLTLHPAWPAVSFLSTVDPDDCCRLLAEIVDPRWFVHHERPGRLTRLDGYLGLTPENFTTMLAMPGLPQGHNGRRALLAARVWLCAHPFYLRTWPAGSPLLSASSASFPWPTFTADRSRVQGLLRATQRIVHLLARVWLAAIAGGRKPYGFDPVAFFSRDDDAALYLSHCRHLTAVAAGEV